MKSGRCPNRYYDMYRVKSFERWPAFSIESATGVPVVTWNLVFSSQKTPERILT
jgi:hypothetical protein